MEETVNCITLEDNQEYAILDDIEIGGVHYLYLGLLSQPDEFCIRKMVEEEKQTVLTGLDNDEEFDLALMQFTKKHKDMLEN